MATKILTEADLKGIRDRVTKEDEKYRLSVMLCGGTGCHASGSRKLHPALKDALSAKNLLGEIKLVETGCNGFCAMGPVMTILPEHIFYQKVDVSDVPEIVERHLLQGHPMERLMYQDPVTGKSLPTLARYPLLLPPDRPGPAQQGAHRPRENRRLH